MARKVIAEFDAIDGPFINKLRAIDASVTRFERGTLSSFGRVEKGMNGLLATAARFQTVSGLVAGGLGAGMATSFIDQATRIRRALKEAGDESQEGFNKAFLAAQRSLAGFEAFTQGVQRMKKATDGTFDDSVRNMETLNKLLILGGKTTQERMSTMIQFSQALQANVLQGEELRSLRENAPIELMQAIAREAGGTIQDLKKLGSEGELTSEVMIRALKSLEKEADARMKSVTLTISESAVILRNSGIVAVEGFDKGLGLSRTAVAGLSALANVLGESAEASEMFGKAVQVAGAAMIGVYAGGKVNGAIKSQQAYRQSLLMSAKAAEAQFAKEKQAVVAAQARVTKATALIDKLSMQAAAENRLAAANAAHARASATLTAAQGRYAAATVAVEAAQARLLLSTRAVAAAGAMLRGAWAFLGGWPGLILTAGLAFMTLRGNVESAAERFDRLTSGAGDASTAADTLREVQSRLNEAIAEAGSASDEAHQKIIANTKQELEAKKTLLALENKRLLTKQDERRVEMDRLRADATAAYAGAQSEVDAMTMGGYVDENAAARAFAEADRIAASIQDKIDELNASMVLTGQTIAENEQTIRDAAITAADAVASTMSGVVVLGEKAQSTYDDMLRTKQDEAVMQQLIAQYGEDSLVVAEARAFAERLAYEELVKSKGISGPFLDDLMQAYDAAAGIADADMASGVAAAAGEAKSLADWLLAALGRAAAIARQAANAQTQLARMQFENSPGGKALIKYGARGSVENRPIEDGRGFVLNDGKFVDPNAPSKGRGGGGSARAKENDLQKEALSLIESMMTAEEKRAERIRDAVELRTQLVAKYGEEHEMVQAVDEAIKRMNESMEDAKSLQEQFWGTMSDAIASSIDEWKGWGNLVRSILASLVRKYGEDFFVALFTPGRQAGDSLGTAAANALTGQLHTGGGKSNRSARSVPAAAFIGAPRFHKGLMGLKSDEFTAILQDGETVLPKGVGLGGDRVTVVNHNDFRGVDASSRAYVEGKLKELEQSIPGKALAALTGARRRREIR